MAKPIRRGNKITRLIIGAMTIIAAVSYFNTMPLRADSRLMSCPALAKKLALAQLTSMLKKNDADTGPVMTYERWCSRAPGVVCPVGDRYEVYLCSMRLFKAIAASALIGTALIVTKPAEAQTLCAPYGDDTMIPCRFLSMEIKYQSEAFKRLQFLRCNHHGKLLTTEEISSR